MIYLDNAAFSQSMRLGELRSFANPNSRSHALGLEERRGVEDARNSIAELLGGHSPQVVFTSGATESAEILWRRFAVTWDIPLLEHKCLSSKIGISRDGDRVTFPVRVVTSMAVNNETGLMTDLASLPTVEGGVIVSDITQGVSKVPCDRWSNADFCFGSAHKWHGPAGVGFIMAKNIDHWDLLVDHQNRGAQERGVRPGTLNGEAIKHAGEVAKWMLKNGDEYRAKLKHLQSTFENKIKSLTDCWIIGADQERAPHITSLNLPGVDNEALIAAVNDRLAIASGSACTSEKVEPSHVLMAMFNDREIADTTVRISYGWFNTEAEVLEAAEIIAKAAETIRSFSL